MTSSCNCPIGLRGLHKGVSTVYMGISDEMEVATMATDEATVVEIKVREDRITFSIKLENVGRAMKAKKPAKNKCCNFRDFVLLISHFRRLCGWVEFVSSVNTTQNNSWYATISPEKPTSRDGGS